MKPTQKVAVKNKIIKPMLRKKKMGKTENYVLITSKCVLTKQQENTSKEAKNF